MLYYFFRDYAINAMMQSGKIVNVDKEIIYMAEHDAHSLVRENATRALSMVDAPDKISIYKRIVQQEKHTMFWVRRWLNYFRVTWWRIKTKWKFWKDNSAYLTP